MKCWTFLVLQVLITAAEDTSVAPQQDYCPEPPDERSLYRVHEDAVGDDGALAQGSVLRYRCGAGYASSGPISVWSVTCTRSYDGVLHWVLPDHDCRLVTCEPLENLANGFVETEGNEYGSTARYLCKRGFRLRGEAERKCGPDGLWTGYAPICQEVTCPAPEPPDGGFSDISKDAGPQRLGTVVHYWCPQLLVLVGSRSSTCLSVGVWSFDPPKCSPPCEVPELESTLIVEEKTSGWGKKIYSQIPPGTQLLDKNNLFLKCKEGYWYNGLSLTPLSCRDGHWDPAQPWCKEKPCRELPKVKNAQVIGPVPHGQQLEYTCYPEYRLISTGITPYCWLGKVVGTLPKCRQKDCRLEDIPEIQNGFLEGTPNISHTSVIRFRCNEGYSSDGQQSMWCSYGKWEGRRPSCLKPTAPPPPPAGVHRRGGHDTNTNGAGEDPYEIGSSTKSPQLRRCKLPERQMRFYAADGNIRVLSNDNVTHGTVLRFHCRPLGEIRLGGNEWSQCMNGTWSNEVPYCYEPGRYDVVIHLKETAGTAVSPDGYLNIDPRFEVEMKCESYHYPPRLELIEPLFTWKRVGVRSSLKGFRRMHYVSAKFILPEDYEGIVRCSNDYNDHTQIIKIRGRYLRSCKIPAHLNATVVTRINKEIVTVACKPPYVLRGEARALCLAHSEWEKPFPECVLPAPSNIYNEHGDVKMQSAKPVLEQTTEIPRLKGPSNLNCKVLPIENVVYRRNMTTSSREIQLDKEFANGTFIYFHCRGDRTSYKIRCLKGFWEPAPSCPPDLSVPATSHQNNEKQSERRDHDGLPVQSDPRTVVPETTQVEAMNSPEQTNVTANVELSQAPDADKQIASAAPQNKQPHNLTVYTSTPTSTKPPDIRGPIPVPASKQPYRTQELVLPENMTAAPNSREQGLPSRGGTLPAGITATSTAASPGFSELLDTRPNGTTTQSATSEDIGGINPIENSSINQSSMMVKGQTQAASGRAPGQNETWHMSCGFANFDSRVKGFIRYQRVNFSAQISHNTTVQFHCEPVGRTSGSVVAATCLDGKWTGNVEVPPKCDLSGENPTVQISGAEYEVGPNAFLHVKPLQWIRVECKIKEGSSHWEVLVSNWKGEKNSSVFEKSVIDFYIERKFYVFNCRVNEVIRRSILVRGSDQRFCTYPSLENGVKVVRQTDSEMRFACNDNLLLKGLELIRCSEDGQWDNLPPQCVEPRMEHTCDVNSFLNRVPPEVVIEANASEVAAGTVYHAFCKNTGYIFDGQSRVVCNVDGTWGFDPIMRCNRSCAIPPLAPGVNVVRRTAAEMRFACQSNLALEGPEQIHCSRTGEWDAKPPVCVQPQKELTCDVNNLLSRVPPEVVIEANASEVAAGTVYHAFCKNTGHIFNGQSRVFCNTDGTWSFDARMSCVKGCPNFGDQDESLIIEGILPTYQLGDSITLSCPGGTELDPPVERITCLGDRWSETKLPHCLDRFPFR